VVRGTLTLLGRGAKSSAQGAREGEGKRPEVKGWLGRAGGMTLVVVRKKMRCFFFLLLSISS
jgi:hypothetical protein